MGNSNVGNIDENIEEQNSCWVYKKEESILGPSEFSSAIASPLRNGGLSCKQRARKKSGFYLTSILLILSSNIPVLPDGRTGKPWRRTKQSLNWAFAHFSLPSTMLRQELSQPGYVISSFVVPFQGLPSSPHWSWLLFLPSRPRAVSRRSDHIPFPGFNYHRARLSQLLFPWLW